MMTEPWLPADDIGEHLRVAKGTVYAWIADKDTPAQKVGRPWMSQANEADVWIWSGGTSAGGAA